MRNTGKTVRPTRRPGEVRRLISTLLEQASAPLSAYDLRSLSAEQHERLYAPQVYRALNELIVKGTVLRIETLNAFCSSRPGPIAVGICRRCGQVQQIDMGDINLALGQLFAERGFQLDRLVVEGSGYCSRCRSRLSVEDAIGKE